ncbi:MAG: hypothetical protein J5617_00385 [Bacilli bacterium]|nr:hypothetical protein [Bacilli bacterium]
MNVQERKNLTYRLLASLILLISAGMILYTFVVVLQIEHEQLFLDILTLSTTSFFLLVELFFILKGGKKESNLYKIGFNDNGKLNNVPLIAVMVGTAFGLGLIGLGVSVYFVRYDETTIRTSMLVILSVAVFLVTNCLIYYLYILMFRKREVRLEDLIK